MEFDFTPLFLLPLVAGFVFIKEWERLRYLVPREDGNKFYFRSAFWGLIVCFVTFYLLIGLSRIPGINHLEIDWFDTLGRASFEHILFITLVTSPLAAYAYAAFLNLFTDELRYYYDALRDNEFELLLVDAMSSDMMIMVTLEDDKVYAGWVFETSDPYKKERKYFSIIPVISGYRTDGKKVEFTTFYEDVYKKTESELGHLDIHHFVVVLPIHRIISARAFDPEAYAAFQVQQPTDSAGSLPQDGSAQGART